MALDTLVRSRPGPFDPSPPTTTLFAAMSPRARSRLMDGFEDGLPIVEPSWQRRAIIRRVVSGAMGTSAWPGLSPAAALNEVIASVCLGLFDAGLWSSDPHDDGSAFFAWWMGPKGRS